jgi:hypothetical protein
VDVGVEVADALVVARDRVGEGGDALRVVAVAAAAVVGGTALGTVAVDVHVDEVAARALQVDDLVVCHVVAAVGEG